MGRIVSANQQPLALQVHPPPPPLPLLSTLTRKIEPREVRPASTSCQARQLTAALLLAGPLARWPRRPRYGASALSVSRLREAAQTAPLHSSPPGGGPIVCQAWSCNHRSTV